MAGFAEAAELAEPEGGIVTAMRLDVVRNRRRRDAADFQAVPA